MSTQVVQSRLEQLDSFITEALKDVCSTMLGWAVASADCPDDGHPASFELHEMNGCVGFGGRLTGSIFLSCSDHLAVCLARRILGTEVQAGSHEVSDVIGELTNMLAGGCKSRLCDQDCPVVMSIPNIIRGKFIKAATRDVKFMLQRCYPVPIPGEQLKVIMLGKFD